MKSSFKEMRMDNRCTVDGMDMSKKRCIRKVAQKESQEKEPDNNMFFTFIHRCTFLRHKNSIYF